MTFQFFTAGQGRVTAKLNGADVATLKRNQSGAWHCQLFVDGQATYILNEHQRREDFSRIIHDHAALRAMLGEALRAE
jgi:hypothetical protein